MTFFLLFSSSKLPKSTPSPKPQGQKMVEVVRKKQDREKLPGRECDQCKRFYPIIDEIPMMLPDELRNKKEDLEFLAKWRSKMPADIIEGALPYNLS